MDVARSFSSITFLSKVVGVKYVDSAQATGPKWICWEQMEIFERGLVGWMSKKDPRNFWHANNSNLTKSKKRISVTLVCLSK